MKGSAKPCPGCGQIDTSRPANKVCADCAYLLKQAARMEEQLRSIAFDEVVVCPAHSLRQSKPYGSL